MSVAFVGTGRRTFDALAFFRNDGGAELLEDAIPCREVVRMCLGERRAVREGGDGASPKMKYLMNQPRKITTDSWPRRKPWVKVRDILEAGARDPSPRLERSFRTYSGCCVRC